MDIKPVLFSPLLRGLGGLLGALLGVTLYYGGDADLAKALVAAGGGLAFLLAPAPRLGLSTWLRWGVVAPVAVVLAWCAVGLLPWGSLNIWQEAPAPALWPAFSVAPGQTLAAWVLALGYAGWGAAAWRVACQPRGSVLLVRGVAALGVVLALYAVAVYALGNGFVFLSPKTAYKSMLTGTFIYHNSFAAFMGVGMLALLAVMLERAGEISGQLPLLRRLKAFYWLVVQPRWWVLPLWVLEFVALVLASSRAGLACVVAGHLLLVVALAAGRRSLRAPMALLAVVGIFAGATVLATQGHNLARRMEKLTTEVDGRTALYETTRNLIAQSPWTGSGLGTLPAVFPAARIPEVRGKTEHAHQLYLETAAELGLPALVVLVVSGTVLLARLLEGVRTRRRAVVYPALGVAVLGQLALHSMVDFILAIPAVALAGLLLLAAALAQAEGAGKSDAAPVIPRTPWLAKAAAGGVAAVGLWLALAIAVAGPGQAVVKAFLAKQMPTSAEVAMAETRLNLCITLNPLNATCRVDYAQLLASEASLFNFATPEGQAALTRAEAAHVAALRVDVTNPFIWWRLAQIHNLQGQAVRAAADMVQSVLFGPREMVLARMRLPLMRALLPFARQEDKPLLKENIDFVVSHPSFW